MIDEIHEAFVDSQRRIDDGRGSPADYVVVALLGTGCDRVLMNARVLERSQRDRDVVRAIQRRAAQTYLYALHAHDDD